MSEYQDRYDLVKLALQDAITIVDEVMQKPTTTAIVSVFERLLPNGTIIRVED